MTRRHPSMVYSPVGARLASLNPGVVHGDVQATEGRHGVGDHPFHGLGVCDVDVQKEARASGLPASSSATLFPRCSSTSTTATCAPAPRTS